MKLWLMYLMLKITHNYKLCCWHNSWKFFMWLVLCLTFNNSAKSWSNSTFWGCFGILRKSRIQNCHWNSILSKISWRKTWNSRRQMKWLVLYKKSEPLSTKKIIISITYSTIMINKLWKSYINNLGTHKCVKMWPSCHDL